MGINLAKTSEIISWIKNNATQKIVKTACSANVAKTSSLRFSQLAKDVFESADKNALKEIVKHCNEVRPKKGVLTLGYGAYNCNVPFQKNNYYRFIGQGGYEDFARTGLIRAKQNCNGKLKPKYDFAYFFQGFAGEKYARNDGAKYIAETTGDKMQIALNHQHYPRVPFLDKKYDKIRIWKLVDGTSDKYEIVYDTLNDVISRNPKFRV